MRTALVTGAAGFIGSHMVRFLKARGYWVRGVDIRPGPEFGWLPHGLPDEYLRCDLRDEGYTVQAFKQAYFDEVYHFAADMGGIGFITKNFATITRNNASINANVFEMARAADVGVLFYSSSACVYPAHLQDKTEQVDLKEGDAWPAAPEKGYGLEKLFAEETLCYYAEQYGMKVRIARFHNIYGPYGTYQGGREKAPAAMCRKVVEATRDKKDCIDIWGDGEQTRSFMYIDDCLEGVFRLTQSSHDQPLNLGSSEMVTINALARMVMEVAGVQLAIGHVDGPQGVRGRNCDPGLMKYVLNWAPTWSLQEGLGKTYPWIRGQMLVGHPMSSEAVEVYERHGREP